MPLPVTFNVGPSRLTAETKNDLRDAVEMGIAEMSHRSRAFSEMSQKTIDGLRSFFEIPEDYRVFFTSSATEAMELTIRNVVRHRSFHFVCGRFSRLFVEISQTNLKTADSVEAEWGTSPPYDPSLVPTGTELITITANETSTGVMCLPEDILRIRRAYPETLLAVDITSIAGMKTYPIQDADLWLFSVQKGFGLPSGLGVLIVSPRAFMRSEELRRMNENRAGLFTFASLDQFMREKAQTVCTPNVLTIFLLGRQLERWNAEGGSAAKDRQAQEKADLFYGAVERSKVFRCFVADPLHRSLSVAVFTGDSADIAKFHVLAEKEGLLPGKGYGKLKESTVRVALFPAITKPDLERLIAVMERVEKG